MSPTVPQTVARTTPSPFGLLRLIAGAAALLLAASGAMRAQVVVPPALQIGSSNPVTAEPPVTRPGTTPCVVPLFQNLTFADFTLKAFSYAPPSACPGPWAKVVFTADFTVTAGRQFDRTAKFYLGHANIYFGTTAEPRRALSPSWHVERDVTDLSPIFKMAQTGEADLGNFVGVSGGVSYTGIIYANAALTFYPTSPQAGAPSNPDIVVPVNGPGGDAGTLNTTSDHITQTLNLPKNVERVYLDVIAQSQSNDEQWFFCVPTPDAANLGECGNTAFRETEVTIDGKPAGVAPIYPWIYTGGLDPYLWEPITGVQTLDFKPYRVDLTPFAGVLSDGNPHTVAVSVYNANNYFVATANLLAYLDRGSQQVTGGIISNTLAAAPAPEVTTNLRSYHSAKQGSTYTGGVAVISKRAFTIAGYVNTSHGLVKTTVEQDVDFRSHQQFDVSASAFKQSAQQTSTVDSRTTTLDSMHVQISEQHFSFPLDLDYVSVTNADLSSEQTTTSDQKYLVNQSISIDGLKSYDSKVREEVNSTDELSFDPTGKFLGPTGSKSKATYTFSDSHGACYNRTLVAEAQKLISVTNGLGCKDNQNH